VDRDPLSAITKTAIMRCGTVLRVDLPDSMARSTKKKRAPGKSGKRQNVRRIWEDCGKGKAGEGS